MAQDSDQVRVYLEVGKKRAIAGAVDWMGWCRWGRDEEAALRALLEYGPRYSRILRGTPLHFKPPAGLDALTVVERLEGNATTDYGVPAIAPSADREPADEADVERLTVLLRLCWQAFDAAVQAARGKPLRKGPRGGGRDLDAIISHVTEAEKGYIRAAGGSAQAADSDVRQAVIDTLVASAQGQLSTVGPRGGARWTVRYFARRVAYHVLDHAWEIEDRVE